MLLAILTSYYVTSNDARRLPRVNRLRFDGYATTPLTRSAIAIRGGATSTGSLVAAVVEAGGGAGGKVGLGLLGGAHKLLYGILDGSASWGRAATPCSLNACPHCATTVGLLELDHVVAVGLRPDVRQAVVDLAL